MVIVEQSFIGISVVAGWSGRVLAGLEYQVEMMKSAERQGTTEELCWRKKKTCISRYPGNEKSI